MDEAQKKARRQMAARQRIAKNRFRHSLLLTGIALVMLLVILLGNLIVKDRPFSDTENRSLAQRPSLSLSAITDGSFFTRLTDWYSDQFMGRDGWISLHLRELRWLGQRESGGVYLGKQGRLLSEPETPDEPALENTLTAINTFSAAHPELHTRMMLVPGAAAVMRSALPKNAPVRDQLADIRQVRDGLDGSIQWLEAGDVLLRHAGEEIFYKTDHHWTSYGAYLVYADTCPAMDLTPGIFTIYTVTEDFEGTLASKSGSHAQRDAIEIYGLPDDSLQYYVTYGEDTARSCSIYRREALEEKDKYTVFFGGNHDKVEIRTTANTGKSLLLFKDSFANCFVQFLLPGYDRITIIDPRYYYGSLDSILNGGVTDVLFLYSADTLLTDASLADVLRKR